MKKILPYWLDANIPQGLPASIQETIVYEMAKEQNTSLQIGAAYHFPYHSTLDKLKLNLMPISEARLWAVFQKVIENQPNIRAIFREDEEGKVRKDFVSMKKISKGISIYKRLPREEDLGIKNAPTFALYSYPKPDTGEWVYHFRMHHISADAAGGFHILKGVGLLDLSLHLHYLLSAVFKSTIQLALESVTGYAFLPQRTEIYHPNCDILDHKKDMMSRLNQICKVLNFISPYVPKAIQSFTKIGTPTFHPEYDIYSLAEKQSRILSAENKRAFCTEIQDFQQKYLQNYANLSVGIEPQFLENNVFKMPWDLKNVFVKGKHVTNVSHLTMQSTKWDRKKIDPMVFEINKHLLSGRMGTSLFFEMIYGLAMAYLNGGSPIATRVPRSVSNKQGHSQYSATSTLTAGICLNQSFIQNILRAKASFSKQLKDPFYKWIPAEELCKHFEPALTVQSCSNFLPESMSENPFPIILAELAYRLGKPNHVDLYLGTWFHKHYQILIDHTIRAYSTSYKQTISTNAIFIKPGFGLDVIIAIKTIILGLESDLQNQRFRPISNYFETTPV